MMVWGRLSDFDLQIGDFADFGGDCDDTLSGRQSNNQLR